VIFLQFFIFELNSRLKVVKEVVVLSKFAKWSGMLLAVCVVSSCASLVEGKPESIVKQRSTARWDALIEGKLETAYTFETPEYREIHSFSDFRKTVRGVGVWQKATIESVECDPDKCSVTARIYVMMKFGLAFEKVETNGQATENWIQSTDRQWYHVSDH
jgi:hypothetical protein